MSCENNKEIIVIVCHCYPACSRSLSWKTFNIFFRKDFIFLLSFCENINKLLLSLVILTSLYKKKPCKTVSCHFLKDSYSCSLIVWTRNNIFVIACHCDTFYSRSISFQSSFLSFLKYLFLLSIVHNFLLFSLHNSFCFSL